MSQRQPTIPLALAFAALLLALGLAPRPAAAQQSIVRTKHNLSVSGPGPVRAMSESRVCIFCHTPHGSRTNAPLWNRRDATSAYLPYNSPTLKAQPGQPTGASKLCLSCHDGTIAMGDLVSEPQAVTMSGSQTMPPGHGLIGTDLRDDHPISFNYFDSLAALGSRLSAPGTWDPRVRLDAASQLQCTTCHDPHDDQWGRFMVMDNREAALCRVCHVYDRFDQTPHALSTAQPRAGGDPWPHTDYPDVRTNACMNCHTSHHAGGREGLLTSRREEEVCFACHDGGVAAHNLKADFNKVSRHPVALTQGTHQSGESPLQSGDHVECADCHNPHRAHDAPALAPAVKGVNEGVSGVDASGAALTEAAYEYQICFKCHGDRASAPLGAVTRQISSFNTLREFSPSSPSFHPVEAPGRNTDVPSLIAPLSPASMIYCTDCHNSDQSSTAASGPHGSSHEYLLAREYRTGDNVSESPTAYALCYGCHSRSSILSDQSFKFHSKHVTGQRTPCSVCHDAHGIDYGQGNAVNNARLINFDVSVVKADPASGRLEYRSLGPRSGQCNLSCHGKDHSPLSY